MKNWSIFILQLVFFKENEIEHLQLYYSFFNSNQIKNNIKIALELIKSDKNLNFLYL